MAVRLGAGSTVPLHMPSDPPDQGPLLAALSKAIADVVARFGRPATPSPGPAEATAASEPPRRPAASAAASPVGEAPAAATTTAAKPAGEEAPAAPHAAPPPPPSDTHGTSARDAGPRSAEAGAKRSSGSPETGFCSSVCGTPGGGVC